MLTNFKLPGFDALVALYQKDPLEYEQFRVEVLRQAVAAAAPKHRPALERTIQSIEEARRAAKTPLDAVVVAHSLMCGSLTELQDALHRLHFIGAEMQTILIVDRLKTESRKYHCDHRSTGRVDR